MADQPDCSMPGRRTLHRQASVGGPHWGITVPLIVAAALAQVAGMALLVAAAPDLAIGAFYGPRQLGAVHLLGLAFLSVAIIAALMQLVPVLLRTRLGPSVVLAVMGWGFAAGSWSLALGLWRDEAGATSMGGALLVLSGLAVVAALAAALARSWRSGNFGAPGAGLALATGWLLVVLALGALMAANRVHPFLDIDRLRLIEAHGVVAALGWITGTALAVSLKLAPMFALSHGYRERAGHLALAAWHPGVALTAVGLYLGVPGMAVTGGILLLLGVGLAAWFALSVMTHRKRRVEAPLAHLGLGLTSLALAIVLVIGAWATGGVGPRAAEVAAILAVVGMGCGLTAGHLFKVQPMLVWTGRFAHLTGTPGVPRLTDLYPHGLAVAEQVVFAAGLVGLVAGVLTGIAPVAVAGAVALLAASLAVMAAVAMTAAHRVPTTSPPRHSPTAPAP